MDWLRIGALFGTWLSLMALTGYHVHRVGKCVHTLIGYQYTIKEAISDCFLDRLPLYVPSYAIMGVMIMGIIGVHKSKASYILPFITVGVFANFCVLPYYLLEVIYGEVFTYGQKLFIILQGLWICNMFVIFKYYKAIKERKSRSTNKNSITFQNLITNEENV